MARPGSASAPGRGQASRWIGLTNVTSTATCAPWKEGRPIRNDLQAAGVGYRQPQVQVAEEDVSSNPSPCFAADLGYRPFHGDSTAHQDSGCCAGCAMVTQDVELPSAAAHAGGGGQG